MPRVLAHHLYDLAVCEHRIALDARLPRDARTPPDAAAALLFEAGDRFEREVVEPLGWPAVSAEDGFDAAFARTLDLMRSGVAGIDQGVLIDRAFLARPDLLERSEGPSRLGAWHYVPGDVKSALAPRTDAVLQVGFAARLLETIQGRRPERGFLILGDGTKEWFDLASVWRTIEDATARAQAVADETEPTRPFFSGHCARCRWRGTCLPELQSSRDASFVFGLTRTLHRVFARHGVCTLDDLARADATALAAAGAPVDALDRLGRQARALLEGVPHGKRRVPLPRGTRREFYVRVETDPVDAGEAFLFAWGAGPAGGEAPQSAEVAIATGAEERAEAFSRLAAALERDAGADDPVYVYGRATTRAFDRLGERLGTAAARLGDLEGRFVDLAPWVRRAAAFPVFLYRFDEIAAVVEGRPRPAPDEPDDASFVLFEAMRKGLAPDGASRLDRTGRDAVAALHAIRAWLA